MYMRIVANIDGDIYFSDFPLKILSGDVEIEFKGKLGKVEKVSATTIIPEEEEKLVNSIVEFDKEDKVINISLSGSKPTYTKLIEKLQTIESSFAFFTFFGLQRILWQYPKIEYLEKTDSGEFQQIEHSFEYGSHEYSSKFLLDRRLFSFISNYSDTKILILAAFWREGKYHQTHNRIVESIYNYYFIIEDSILDGKSKGAEKILRNNTEFIDMCKRTISLLLTNETIGEELKKHITIDVNNPSAKEIADFIVKIRGNLHHFSSKQKGKKPFPFEQSKYYCLSIFFELITREVINKLIGKLPFSYHSMSRSYHSL